MKTTKRYFIAFSVIIIVSIIGFVAMFCLLGNKKDMYMDFELVAAKDSNKSNDIVKDLKIDINCDIGNGRVDTFTYKDGEVSDIKIGKVNNKGYITSSNIPEDVSLKEYLEIREDDYEGVRLGEDSVEIGEDAILFNPTYDDHTFPIHTHLLVKLINTQDEGICLGGKLVNMNSIYNECEDDIEYEEDLEYEDDTESEENIEYVDTDHKNVMKNINGNVYTFYKRALYVISEDELITKGVYKTNVFYSSDAEVIDIQPIFTTSENCKKILHASISDEENPVLTVIGVLEDKYEGYTLYAYAVDAKTGLIMFEKKDYVEDKEGEFYFDVTTDAGDNYTIVTVGKSDGYQRIFKIDQEKDKDGRVNDILFDEIDSSNWDGKLVGMLVDTCMKEDGTLYVCYFEAINKLSRYDKNWARRIIFKLDKSGFCNIDFDTFYKWDDHVFNGVAIKAYKDGKCMYHGYLESDIYKLFVDDIEIIKEGHLDNWGDIDKSDISISVE